MSDELEALKSRFRRLAEFRIDRDVAKKAAERAEQEYREAEAEIISLIEDAGLKGKIEFDFGGDLGTISFQRRKTVYGRIIDKRSALESFEALGIKEQMTTETKVEARRLNEFVRQADENGENLPAGVDLYEKKFVTVSRGR